MFPQEIIEYIIMLSDTQTIINNRELLSEYCKKKSYQKSVSEMINQCDIQCLDYNFSNIKENIDLNKIILHSNLEDLDALLYWAYSKKIYCNIFTLKLLLLLADNNKLQKVLEFLNKKEYYFNYNHYLLAIEWSNSCLVDFLLLLNIRPENIKTNIIKALVRRKNINFIKFFIDKNIVCYSELLEKVITTYDKNFILKCIDIIPLTTIHWTIKNLVLSNVDNRFILWLLFNLKNKSIYVINKEIEILFNLYLNI